MCEIHMEKIVRLRGLLNCLALYSKCADVYGHVLA